MKFDINAIMHNQSQSNRSAVLSPRLNNPLKPSGRISPSSGGVSKKSQNETKGVSKKLLEDVKELRRQAVFYAPGEWDWEAFLREEEQTAQNHRQRNQQTQQPQPNEEEDPFASFSAGPAPDFFSLAAIQTTMTTQPPSSVTSSTLSPPRSSSMCGSICQALQRTTLLD